MTNRYWNRSTHRTREFALIQLFMPVEEYFWSNFRYDIISLIPKLLSSFCRVSTVVVRKWIVAPCLPTGVVSLYSHTHQNLHHRFSTGFVYPNIKPIMDGQEGRYTLRVNNSFPKYGCRCSQYVEISFSFILLEYLQLWLRRTFRGRSWQQPQEQRLSNSLRWRSWSQNSTSVKGIIIIIIMFYFRQKSIIV